MNSRGAMARRAQVRRTLVRLRAAFRCGSLLVLTLVFAVGCSAQGPGQTNKAQAGLEVRTLTLEGTGGPLTLKAEIADSSESRAAGLMFRKSLDDGTGMLFVFDRDEVLSFWMKNTIIPLSIAFISYDGIILEIRDMYPNDVSPVHSSRSVRYALEVPQGWFGRAGVRAGSAVRGL